MTMTMIGGHARDTARHSAARDDDEDVTTTRTDDDTDTDTGDDDDDDAVERRHATRVR